MTTPNECAICLEGFESYHKIAKPQGCSHGFHVACIMQWLQYNRTCPLCRHEITYDAQIQWHSLFAVAIALTRQELTERCLCAFTFLDTVLKQYPNSQSFKQNFPSILRAIEHLQITQIRLPFLAIPTRQDALRERRRWKQSAEELLGGRIALNQLTLYHELIQQWI